MPPPEAVTVTVELPVGVPPVPPPPLELLDPPPQPAKISSPKINTPQTAKDCRVRLFMANASNPADRIMTRANLGASVRREMPAISGALCFPIPPPPGPMGTSRAVAAVVVTVNMDVAVVVVALSVAEGPLQVTPELGSEQVKSTVPANPPVPVTVT